VRATAAGRGTFQKELSLEEGDVDLGTIALDPSHDLRLRVVDGDGAPIGDARVKTNHGFAGETAEDGSVRVTGISQTEPVVLTVAAPRFAKQTQTLSAPFSKETEIVLARAFTIEGRVVDEQSAPVSDAVIVVMIGSRYQRLESGPDGEFSLDLDAGSELELRFESPTRGFYATTQAEGREGEVRDLGSIRLDAGGIVRGRVVSTGGIPVSRARIWAIRPAAAGAVASWVAGRVVQAASDDEGEFELRGLPVGPSVLRVDATDFARAYRDVVVGSEPVSIGAIEIDRGSIVTVSANGGEGVARIDLRGEWVDADMITAPVVDGEARLRNVPRGQHRVTVLQGRAVTCERQVSVTSGQEAVVRCPAPMIVTGRVLLGGSPASGGSISWKQIAGTDSLIDTTISPMGARQERVYGLGFGTITVPVREDGSYETRELRSGEWQVSWRSGDGVVTPDRAVNVPDQPMASVRIEFAGSVIRGSVVDASGKPVQGARIREIQGPLFAMTTSEGTFTISGVLPGTHRLQASLGMKSSSIREIRIEDGKQAPDVALVLEDKRRNELAITVTGLHGEPRPHALVFVEAAGVLRTLTADAAGIAVGAFPEGLPDGSRMIAFAANDWAFGRLRRTGGDDDRQTATIRFGATGRLRIRSSTKSGVPEIRSTEGGDLAWILARAGFHHFLTPQSPIEIQGLPPGAYEVSIDSARAVATVYAGRDASADLY
ncbi:MAG TPA: carboxypeptidase-like regulatory domain-containing protein, partial [Thermoanaerobaculia bacterium]|nr:carboxypeptidase-like regulatory domain-containing protein [Thermoanaerobaculia bacterium]